MKNGFAKLDVSAFALASGVIGFVFSWVLGGMMGYQGYGMMAGFGFGSIMSLWMAVLAGIVGGLFAWLYNVIADRMDK